jgi:hypothetical protein
MGLHFNHPTEVPARIFVRASAENDVNAASEEEAMSYLPTLNWAMVFGHDW